MKYALINTDTHRVVNVIDLEKEANWSEPIGHIIVRSDIAEPGDTYHNRRFIKPEITEMTPGETARADYAAASTAEKLAIIGRRLGLV